MRFFISKLFSLALVFLLAYILSSYFLFKSNRSVTKELIKYQREKIDSIQSLDIALIGDSSLGNSIDASILTKKTDLEIQNFALNGFLGYEGNYLLLKRIHKKHPGVKKVIMMQTLGLPTRKFSVMGIVENINSFDDFVDLNFKYKYQLIKGLPSYLNSMKLNQLISRKGFFSNDYIKQKGDLELKSLKIKYKKENINKDKIFFLSKISNYCKEHKIDLVYMNGPIYYEIHDNSKAYLQNFEAKLDSMNIKYLKYIDKLNFSELGNTEDHLSPELKSTHTLNFYNANKSLFEL